MHVWIKWMGALGLGAVATTGLLNRDKIDASTMGILRFGRAAIAVGIVVADYKWTLRKVNNESSEYKNILSKIHLRSAERLRDMCSSNGGGFIKVGQHIGSLEYLLPSEYVTTMKVFHHSAPTSRLEDLYAVIRQDLGKHVEEIFSSFDPEPLGAASLAQVHRATLLDGTVVAVKVQHPKVKAHSFVDIKTMELLVKLVKWIFPQFKYMWLAEETKKNLPLELDFMYEGKNCERVGRLLQHFEFLKVPRIHWEYTTERVLTMEYCEGGKVDDRAYMLHHNISVNEVSRKLGRLYSEMIFVHGYVHCDPHPGNVLVHQTPAGSQIILLDHGLYQTLTDEFRVNYCKLWQCLIKRDIAGIRRYSRAMNAGEMYGLFACIVSARSWTSIAAGIDSRVTVEEDAEIKENAASFLPQITDILNRIPRQMLLILKTNDVLRSIECTLKTRADATSFINMSRCCVRATAKQEIHESTSFVQRCLVRLNMHWQLFVIFVYEVGLKCRSWDFLIEHFPTQYKCAVC